MSHRVYWIQEPQILALEYTGVPTPEDLRGATSQALAEVEKRHMHFLVDLSKADTKGAELLKAGNEVGPFLSLLRHKNAGWFAMVGPNAMARFAITLFFRQSLVKIFTTKEEAVTFLLALTETFEAVEADEAVTNH
jgi:hypothetical protein